MTGSNIDRTRLCANLYPTVRQAILRSHPWNCATKRVVLSPDSTAPAFGFANRFLFPSDWLKTLQVGEDERCPINFRTEGRYWLCDETAFYLVYIYDNVIAGSYDATLIEAMELGMAAALCYPVTKSTSLRDSLNQELKQRLQLARTADGQDDPAETLGQTFPLLDSRFRSGPP